MASDGEGIIKFDLLEDSYQANGTFDNPSHILIVMSKYST